MFNALNKFMSRLDGEPANLPSDPRHGGFQVLRNNDKDLDLEPWFDYIVGINNRPLQSSDPALFAAEVRHCAGSSVRFSVWSAKGDRTREIYALIPLESPTLGVSLRWHRIGSPENVWHVYNVHPDSPAEKAGLLSHSDYVIWSPQGMMEGEAGFANLLEQHIGKPLVVYVYNHEFNVTREVNITPQQNWGGRGVLGCEILFGKLHTIPAPLDEPPHGPGETLFDTSKAEEQEVDAGKQSRTIVPAQHLAPLQSEYHPPPPGPKKQRTAAAAAAARSGLDDFMKEEAEKHRNPQKASSADAKVASPPPPAKTISPAFG